MYVALATFLFGFCSFIILSLFFGVFWINSKVDIPLVLNASVMLGDSILLPIFNYGVFDLALNKSSGVIIKKHLISLFIFLFVILVGSIFFNVSVHQFWNDDIFTDFISLVPGKLSLIGYWHLIFSIIQVCIIGFFIFLWYISIMEKGMYYPNKFHRAAIFLFAFTLLSIVDFLLKYYFVYESKTFKESMQIEGFPFITCITSLIVFSWLYIKELKSSRKIH